jgi:hypothetical protein
MKERRKKVTHIPLERAVAKPARAAAESERTVRQVLREFAKCEISKPEKKFVGRFLKVCST